MVNKSGHVSTFSGINNSFLINSEHVTASNAAFFISLLSHVSDDLKRKQRDVFWVHPEREQPGRTKGSSGATSSYGKSTNDLCISYLSDDFAHILHHHLFCCYRFHSKQAPLVNVTWTETSHFLTELGVFSVGEKKNRLMSYNMQLGGQMTVFTQHEGAVETL